MSGFGPSMPLGEHLEELRWRLFRVLIGLAVVFIAAFIVHAELKLLILQPLRWALAMSDPEILAVLRIPDDADPSRLLRADSFTESPLTAVKVAFYAALAVVIPHVLFELWGFITPGLKRAERHLGFLFVPTAAIFFYCGACLGYFFGLPQLYSWLIAWTAADPTAVLELRQSEYLSFFVTMTLACGLVFDIPWAVLVLIRVRLVTPEQMARSRKGVILGAAIASAILSPPDPVSQVCLLIPMVLLFEAGLLAGRLLYGNQARATVP